MAITLNDNRQLIDEGDSATDWTGTTTLGTTDPVPIEDSGWVGANIGAEIFVSYHTIASTDLSDAVIYCWVFSRLSLGNTADTNGGLMVLLGDATPDRIGYKVNGADSAAFRHDTGPTGWQCAALDTTSLPASPYVDAGVAVNIDLAAILEVGTIVNSLVAAPGMNPTYNVDIMRYLDVAEAGIDGCAADIVGGTSGTPGLWSEIATADRQVGTLQAHGLVRELAVGAFGVQGPLRFGNATGTSASWFEDSNVTVVFETRGFRTDLYKIFITDNGTGTTTFRLHGSALIAPVGVGAEFDADTDADVTDVVIDNGSRIAGFIGGVGLQSGHTVTDTVITGSGQVRANGATMNGSSALQSTVAANGAALLWDVNTDPSGLLDNMTFDKTAGTAHHAIEFGANIPTASITLNNCVFGTDFSAAENTSPTAEAGDETFAFRDTTGTLTVNLIGCTGNFGYYSAGVVVTVIADPVTTLLNVKDSDGNNESGVQVWLRAKDGTDELPFQQAITSVTQGAGTPWTRTVTFTAAHGLKNDDYLSLSGITNATVDNSGAFQVTVTNTTVCTYTSADSGETTFTGTIIGTGGVLYGTTDGSGNISSSRVWAGDQLVKGAARLSSTSPRFKTIELDDTILAASGLTINRRLISDE